MSLMSVGRVSQSYNQPQKLTGILLLILTFGTLQADLKVTVTSYFHWLLALPILFIITSINVRMKWRLNPYFQFILFFLPVTMVFNFLVTSGDWYDIIQSFKIFVLFLSAIIIYNLMGDYKILRNALILNTIINSLLLLFAFALALPTAEIMTSDGRWGNFLNYPGSLAKVGILTLGYSLYGVISAPGKRVGYGVLALLSSFTIFMDGSRTALLGSAISLIFIGGIILLEYIRKNNLTSLSRMFRLSIISISSIALLYYFGGGIAERTVDFLSNILSGDADGGLQRSDSTRYVMLQTVSQAIAQHPIFGTGMGSTVAGVVGAEGMTIHLSYLQLWADAGLLAFVAFILICVFGIAVALTAVYRAMLLKNSSERAFVYGMAAVIIYFIFNGFFHPFSTEWSEWIIFIAPMCILLNFLHRSRLR